MDSTFPQTLHIDGRTIVVTATAAFEVLGSAAAATIAAPEVAAALSAGVAVGAIGAALPVKELGRKDAERLGAEERARFGSVAAMHAAGIELSPFQDQAFLNSLPTEAQLQSRVPNPSAMTAPSFTYEPTAPGENLTSYPQYVAPLDALTLPDPGAPGAAPPNGTPLSMPEIGDTSVEAYAYVSSAGSKEGAAALAAVNKCMPGEEAFRSFGALKNGMHYPTDWEVHHLVEQNQTSRFGSELIQSTANAVALPDDVHRWISSVNSSKPPLDSGVDRTQFSRMRDYVRSLPFDEQRELGIQQARRNGRAQNASKCSRPDRETARSARRSGSLRSPRSTVAATAGRERYTERSRRAQRNEFTTSPGRT